MQEQAWTPERVGLLRQLWTEGETAAAIAVRLGGMSRSAVLGKIFRLRLAGPGSGEIAQKERSAAAPAQNAGDVVRRAPTPQPEAGTSRAAIAQCRQARQDAARTDQQHLPVATRPPWHRKVPFLRCTGTMEVWRESRLVFAPRPRACNIEGRARALRSPRARGQTPRRARPPSARGPRQTARRARRACGARPPRRRAQTATARPCRAAPRRSPGRTRRPQDRRGGRDRARRNSAAPTGSRCGRQARAAPTTGRRAARAKIRFATARSTISRRGVNHKPRPGSRAAISGTIAPVGTHDKAQQRAAVADLAGDDAAALRRSSPAAAPARGAARGVVAAAVAVTPLAPRRRRRLVVEPMRARGPP